MLVLYGTGQCHLCDQAEALLDALDLPFAGIDIIGDETLLARYGTSIPVLRDALGRELYWPFSGNDITAFLAAE